jgi:preprotein translocase subunit SecA
MWPVEAQPDIKEAFDRQLVDPFDVQWREVEQDLAEGEEGMRRRAIDRRPTRVTDAVEELQAWHFGPESQSADDDLMSRIGLMEDEDALDDDLALDDSPPYQRLEPLRAESRIGRNEACPCGSGKKYKKCCGRPAAR